ncbi:MAG: adenylate/guanylate cyclase domain-containing protein [Vicinamibacterales bacterium]
MASSSTEAFASTPVVVLVADLDGFAKLFKTRTDAEMASFLDQYYVVAEDLVDRAGGRIVKFIGDALLAVFPEAEAPAAVSAAAKLRREVEELGQRMGMRVRLGVSVHMGPAVETELGKGPSRRRDVIGRTVNQTFLLGRGAGIRISEPVYRTLPSAERTPWSKNKPPAVYVLDEAGEVLDGLGKSAPENTARW